jgi:hypothetical protein
MNLAENFQKQRARDFGKAKGNLSKTYLKPTDTYYCMCFSLMLYRGQMHTEKVKLKMSHSLFYVWKIVTITARQQRDKIEVTYGHTQLFIFLIIVLKRLYFGDKYTIIHKLYIFFAHL